MIKPNIKIQKEITNWSKKDFRPFNKQTLKKSPNFQNNLIVLCFMNDKVHRDCPINPCELLIKTKR